MTKPPTSDISQSSAAAGEVLPKVVATAPERIWLQVCNDDDCEDCRDSEFPDSHECTWCADAIGGIEVEYVRADLSTPQPPPEAGSVVPDGWVLVPKEPTQAMLAAGREAFRSYAFRWMEGHPAVYEAMIDAAPAPKEDCFCDRTGLGVRGVSCGDCPKDYALRSRHEQ